MMAYTVTYTDYEDQECSERFLVPTEDEARRSVKPGCKEIISVIFDDDDE
jgi:hypothetical protein